MSPEDEFVDKLGSSGRRSMDDERRELPQGWIRAYDPKTEHHFYVDTATKRSIWIHPYDDPTYIASIPDTHPAHPESAEAKAMRDRMAREREAVDKVNAHQAEVNKDYHAAHDDIIHSLQAPDKHKNWLLRQKDKIKMKEHEWEEHHKEKKRMEAERRQQLQQQQDEYLRQRQERMQNDPMYSPPTTAYSRDYANPYGYGYNGGYGYRSGFGYGGMGMGMGGLGGALLMDDMMFGSPFGYGWGYDPFLFGGMW